MPARRRFDRRPCGISLLLALASLSLTAGIACDGGKGDPPPDAPTAADTTLVVSVPDSGLTFASGRVLAYDTAPPDYEIYPEKTLQTLVGFGGAFNEKEWEALGLLSPSERDEVINNLFAPGVGLGLELGRIPIGASDYSLSRYTLDDGDEDPTMERFSLEHDRPMLIPFIEAAQVSNPALRFWASPWTPPPWMKTSKAYNGGAMRDEPAIYAAYALYLAKFVEAYRQEGIPIEEVAVQNEPSIANDYPSCRWEARQFHTFVRDYLGPTFAKRGLSTSILLGTFNDSNNEDHAMAVLRDPAASRFVGALGVQWSGLTFTALVRATAPALPIWQTETDCGNHYWEADFAPDRPPNDWAYALLTWRSMRAYFTAGAAVYSLWNLVLDETGKNIDAKRPWPQNAPVVVDRATQKAIYTPMYDAVAHFSHFAGAGSTLLGGRGTNDVIGFRRPDGRIAVVMVNSDSGSRGVRVKIGDRGYYAELPAHAFATMLVGP